MVVSIKLLSLTNQITDQTNNLADRPTRPPVRYIEIDRWIEKLLSPTGPTRDLARGTGKQKSYVYYTTNLNIDNPFIGIVSPFFLFSDLQYEGGLCVWKSCNFLRFHTTICQHMQATQ